jgi:hypothetical protein
MRTNLTYLTTTNPSHKQAIKDWVQEIDSRMRAG